MKKSFLLVMALFCASFAQDITVFKDSIILISHDLLLLREVV
jgi:hypothetical protein